MNETQVVYAGWIEENLEYVEKLKIEVEYWQKILKKRVFDGTWPQSIKAVITALQYQIVRQIEDCHYYIQRIREEKNAEPCKP